MDDKEHSTFAAQVLAAQVVDFNSRNLALEAQAARRDTHIAELEALYTRLNARIEEVANAGGEMADALSDAFDELEVDEAKKKATSARWKFWRGKRQ